MDLANSVAASARHDGAEQRGDGVRELQQRFQDATTSAEFEEIAAEGSGDAAGLTCRRRLKRPTTS